MMERKTKIFWILFFMMVIVFFMIILLNYSFFSNLIVKGVNKFGYPAVFVFAYLIDLVETPISNDVVSVTAVLLGLNAFFIFIFAAAGDLIGTLTSFHIGKGYLSSRVKNSCSTNKKYQKYCEFFYKYGRWALLVAMLTPLPNVLFIWLAGAFKMKTKDFVIFGSIPSILRIGIILLITAGIVSL